MRERSGMEVCLNCLRVSKWRISIGVLMGFISGISIRLEYPYQVAKGLM